MELMAQEGQDFALAQLSYAQRAELLSSFLQKELNSYRTNGGPPKKNPYLAKAAQFNYHYFRYPGDALIFLKENLEKNNGFIPKMISVLIGISIKVFSLLQRIKKTNYFQH